MAKPLAAITASVLRGMLSTRDTNNELGMAFQPSSSFVSICFLEEKKNSFLLHLKLLKSEIMVKSYSKKYHFRFFMSCEKFFNSNAGNAMRDSSSKRYNFLEQKERKLDRLLMNLREELH